jgi:membrane protease YdiL (CAAX protease family)
LPPVSTADLILTLGLVVVLPAYMLAKSIVRRGRPSGDRARRYRRTILLVLGPALMLAVLWVANRRPVDWLGLGLPNTSGWILVAVAILVIGTLAIVAPRAKRPANPQRNADAEAMMPVGARETAWFLAFAVVVGAGWEVLYRGYLWWVLAPLLGPVGAVSVMGVSYGVAHGYRGVGPLVGSFVSALLFAAAYATSLSLWWLIVIHIGLPLVGLRLRAKPTP